MKIINVSLDLGMKKRIDKSLTAQWWLDGAVLCCSSNWSHLKPPPQLFGNDCCTCGPHRPSLSGIAACPRNRCLLFALCASRTFSENDCTMVAPADPCLSPTKGELVYSKTAKQCLEEISGTAGQHVRRARVISLCVGVCMRMCIDISHLYYLRLEFNLLHLSFRIHTMTWLHLHSSENKRIAVAWDCCII